LQQDIGPLLLEQVRDAYHAKQALQIRGGGSKQFYGRCKQGKLLGISRHQGIVEYEPSELFITARAGTPLAELESVLNEAGQMLPFEPPHFAKSATVGGMVACGLSGPRRPYAGAVRDAVLGLRCINGKGEMLQFGGQVVKNVAGYDVSRLMSGAMGTLGVLLELSLKVLPRPAEEITLVQEVRVGQAIEQMNRWASKPVGLTAACYDEDRLYLRFSNNRAAEIIVGGDVVNDGEGFWRSIREQTTSFFHGDQDLWRISLPPATPPLQISGSCLIDWGGAQRWLRTKCGVTEIRSICKKVNGHATLFRTSISDNMEFQSLDAAMQKLHLRVKKAFDPEHILNPGRLFADEHEPVSPGS